MFAGAGMLFAAWGLGTGLTGLPRTAVLGEHLGRGHEPTNDALAPA